MMSDMLKRYTIENQEDWYGWIDNIPFIRFDPDWDVQVIPPFSGAMVRFRVKQGDHIVSVYLDCNQQLGYWDGPYWEAYPVDDDIWRVGIDDVDGLLDAIRRGLKQDG